MRRLALALALAAAAASPAAAGPRPFAIRVVDRATRRGVPLVELTTVHNVTYVTDSAGRIAFDEPGLLGRRVFFFVRSHGYRAAKDAFGYEGVALDTRPGGSATVEVDRTDVAERLYRITGAGIYRDTVLLGEKPPIAQPLLNAGVLGQDSAQATVFGGRIYWFWGDTNLARHPLGVFQSTGATSDLPGKGGLSPDAGIDLTYFVDREGVARGVCERKGSNPVWLDGLTTVRDDTGAERMAAHYSRMKDLGAMVEHGLVVWDARAQRFVERAAFSLDDAAHCPRGHAVRYSDRGDYVLFAMPFPMVRAPARLSALAHQGEYEAFTCLAPGARYAGASSRVERDGAGRLVWGWKRGTDPIDQAQERELIAAGLVKPGEARFQVTDAATGEPVSLHNGSLAWNAYRRKWILIAVQRGGRTSFLGDVWYAEADAPSGPWTTAVRIVTHDRYSFYNPVQHAFFDRGGGRTIYFEGTYAATFSGNPSPTPRYDYNQILYRLDLADPRLHPKRP